MLSSQKPPESTLRKCKKGKEKKKRNILQAVESYHPFQGKGLISVDDIRVDRICLWLWYMLRITIQLKMLATQ